jgi:uncharacterized protein (DUF1330 family)
MLQLHFQSGNAMALEMLVGIHVVDDAAFQSYRDEMTPILKSYGGGFGYDFKVSEVLKSKTEAPINRVFTISFPNEDSRNSFFSNVPSYFFLFFFPIDPTQPFFYFPCRFSLLLPLPLLNISVCSILS